METTCIEKSEQMDVVVLAGGLSDERDVSLSSGSQIANALIRKGHRVLLVDLYEGSQYADFASAYAAERQEQYTYDVPKVAPDLLALMQQFDNRQELIGPNVIELCQSADVAFLALHGGIGENGKLQALFDLYRIRYTGSGHAGSLLAMDKHLAKQLMVFNGIPTANWLMYRKGEPIPQVEYPCVVKPNDNGSSIGVKMVDNEAGLIQALKEVTQYGERVMIEQKISGREFSVGVLEGEALPIIEIIPKAGFYDYENKYQANATEEVTPAALTESQTRNMQQLALKVHQILGLVGYSRIDFMLAQSGHMYCIEANTLPGMTPTSLLPQEAAVVGLDYDELCERLLTLAFKK